MADASFTSPSRFISRLKKPQTHPTAQHKKSIQPVKPAPQNKSRQNTKSTGPNPLKRGQKGKIKRIRQKYADQDDEERQLRLLALQGSNAKLSILHDIGKNRKAEKEEEEEGIGHEEEEEVEEKEDEENENESEIEDAIGEKPLPEVDDEKEKKVSMVEDVDPEDEASAAIVEVSTLSTLTGQPVDEDTLLFALPFCAPFSALQKFKYKAKLLPGTQKRGRSEQIFIDFNDVYVYQILKLDICK